MRNLFHLLSLIKHDPVFISGGRRPQRPPKYQLATFLAHVGDETGVKTATVMSIAKGSVFNYTYWVVQALRNIRDNHLAWPGNARQQFLSDEMKEFGFPGCIGIGDGSYICLAGKPINTTNPYAYWCRKKFYAVYFSQIS